VTIASLQKDAGVKSGFAEAQRRMDALSNFIGDEYLLVSFH